MIDFASITCNFAPILTGVGNYSLRRRDGRSGRDVFVASDSGEPVRRTFRQSRIIPRRGDMARAGAFSPFSLCSEAALCFLRPLPMSDESGIRRESSDLSFPSVSNRGRGRKGEARNALQDA